MITAYASLETVKLALTHGAFEYLIKPFSRQDLEDVVRRALERRHAELGARGQVSRLVEEMRRLTAKTRDLEEAARREAFEQSLRVTQLSILREISRTIIGQLDPNEITSAVTAQLQTALGYDSITIASDAPQVESARAAMLVACVIRDAEGRLGYLVADNRPSGRPIDPRERELLEMLAEYLAIALRNSRLYGEIDATKRSLEQLIASAGDAIITITRRRPDRRLESGRRADVRPDRAASAQATDRGVIARGRLRQGPGQAGGRGGTRHVRDDHGGAGPAPAAHAGRDAVGTAQSTAGRARRPDRDRPRHHRAARDREPAAPGREAHRAGPARRRHRPRLQQPPAGDPGLRPADEAEPGQRRADRALAQRGRVGGHGRRGDGPAHPDVRTPATRRAVHPRGHQSDRAGRDRDHPAALGGEHRPREPAARAAAWISGRWSRPRAGRPFSPKPSPT